MTSARVFRQYHLYATLFWIGMIPDSCPLGQCVRACHDAAAAMWAR